MSDGGVGVHAVESGVGRMICAGMGLIDGSERIVGVEGVHLLLLLLVVHRHDVADCAARGAAAGQRLHHLHRIQRWMAHLRVQEVDAALRRSG